MAHRPGQQASARNEKAGETDYGMDLKKRLKGSSSKHELPDPVNRAWKFLS